LAKPKKDIEYQSYLFQVKNSSLIYNFGLDYSYHPEGPYREYLCLELLPVGRYPPKIKGERFQFKILGNREKDEILKNREESTLEPSGIGALEVKGECRQFLCTLPQSMIVPIHTLIQSGDLDCIILRGHRLRYGKAKIIDIRFFTLDDFEDIDDFL